MVGDCKQPINSLSSSLRLHIIFFFENFEKKSSSFIQEVAFTKNFNWLKIPRCLRKQESAERRQAATRRPRARLRLGGPHAARLFGQIDASRLDSGSAVGVAEGVAFPFEKENRRPISNTIVLTNCL